VDARMSRNALTALTAALAAAGGGYKGYGEDTERRRIAKQKEDESREMRESRDESRRLSLLGMGFDPAGGARSSAQALLGAGQTASMAPPIALPGGGAVSMSPVGQALAAAGQQRVAGIDRGRTAEFGGEQWVQPYERTAEGRAEAQRREAEAAEQRRLAADQNKVTEAQRRAYGSLRQMGVNVGEFSPERDYESELTQRYQASLRSIAPPERQGDPEEEVNRALMKLASEGIEEEVRDPKTPLLPGPKVRRRLTPQELAEYRFLMRKARGLPVSDQEAMQFDPGFAQWAKDNNITLPQFRK
jgi:hypothetical protein